MSLDFKKMIGPTDADFDRLATFMTQSPITKLSETIPAGYTYLAQFIDHDISLDSEARTPPWKPIDLSTVFNKRNPTFDLETIYGVDAPPASSKVVRADLLKTKSLLKLGWTVQTLKVPKSFENDLPRIIPNSAIRRPLAEIVDERNDENLLVAQTQVAFLRFHNAIANKLGGADSTPRFNEARRRTIRYYQHIIWEDLLPKIVKKEVLDAIKNGDFRFLRSEMNEVFVPAEFAIAAYRMGHSLIRNSYVLNKAEGLQHLSMLFAFTGRGNDLMRGHLPSEWIINWNWFYDIDGSKDKFENEFNFAAKIETGMADALGKLRTLGTARERNLAAFDLYRGRLFHLSSGQAFADALGVNRVPDSDIAGLLPAQLQDVFSRTTPLWFYLLAEAEKNEDGETSGEAGSHIVAETFFRLLQKTEFSILEAPLSAEEKSFADVANNGKFGMPQMLQFIENNEPGFLNPVEA